MESKRGIISACIDDAGRSLDVAIFVGGSLLQRRYENLVAASKRGVQIRFLIADAAAGWADELAHPFGFRAKEYTQRMYVNASRALMLDVGVEVRWQPFPLPWSFLIADGQRGYVKAIDFVASTPAREFTSADVTYFDALFQRAWSMAKPASRLAGLSPASETAPTLRAFLCHASEDRSAVRDLYRRLTDDRISVWLDEQNLLPGQSWPDEIAKAIRQSDVFLACMSTRSVVKRGFVQRELRLALDVAEEMPPGTIFIVPTRLDECSVPDDLSHLQRVDLFNVDGYDRLVRGLKVARKQR
jgi:hypothetical protein